MAAPPKRHLLDELPNEILERIFAHIGGVDLWCSVRATCRRFSRLLRSNNDYWLERAEILYGLRLPDRLRAAATTTTTTMALEERRDALAHFAAVESAHRRFGGGGGSNPLELRRFRSSAPPHFGDGVIRAVRLFHDAATRKRLCLSGASGGTLRLWDVERVFEGDEENIRHWAIASIVSAHPAMSSICMGGCGRTFYSTGGRFYLKQWFLTEASIVPGATLDLRRRTDDDTQVTYCVSGGDHSDATLYVATERRGPILVDTRAGGGMRVRRTLNPHHSEAVWELCARAGSPYIYSLGDDERLVCTDARALATVATFDAFACEDVRYDVHIDVDASGGCYLALADYVRGRLRFLHPSTLVEEASLDVNAEFAELAADPERDESRDLCVRVTRGAIVCALGAQIRVYAISAAAAETAAGTPARRWLLASGELEAPPSPHLGFTKMDYARGVLALGDGNSAMHFWKNTNNDRI